MDEYIDIVTETGEPTGKRALKSEAHKNGWFHNTTHVWLYTLQGEILLSQRSASKKIFPLLWDVSAAGHVDAGESVIDAAIRETFEELGFSLVEADLFSVGVHRHLSTYDEGSIKDYEFHHAYIAELKSPASDLRLQIGEVESVKLVSFDEFRSLLNKSINNGHFVSSNSAYYEFILKCIRDAIKN